MVVKNGDKEQKVKFLVYAIRCNTPPTSTKQYNNNITHCTYDGETHETGQQEEVVVQVTVVQVGRHPLIACRNGGKKKQKKQYQHYDCGEMVPL